MILKSEAFVSEEMCSWHRINALNAELIVPKTRTTTEKPNLHVLVIVLVICIRGPSLAMRTGKVYIDARTVLILLPYHTGTSINPELLRVFRM